MGKKNINTSNSVKSLNLEDKNTILNEMVRIYENGKNETENFKCMANESKLKQLKIIYETLENKELFEAKHGHELPIDKIELEFIDPNDKEVIDEIQMLEKQIASEIDVDSA